MEFERQQRQQYWWTFKFCLAGSQPKNQLTEKTFLKGIKEIIEFVCALAYSMFLPLVLRKPARLVIYYHGVKKQDIRQFEKQLASLAKKCRVVRVSEIKTAPPNGERAIVGITFDDGLVSFCENALPILRKYNLPAAVCVPTGHLGKKPGWLDHLSESGNGELVMDEKQVAGLDWENFEIFSHGVTHSALTNADDEKLRSELTQSKKKLETITSRPVTAVSYPYGRWDSRVLCAAKEAGYRLGFTIEPWTVDSSPSDVQIGRFSVRPTDNMLKFRLKVMGAYQVTKYLRKAQVVS